MPRTCPVVSILTLRSYVRPLHDRRRFSVLRICRVTSLNVERSLLSRLQLSYRVIRTPQDATSCGSIFNYKMSKKPLPSDLTIRPFATRADFETFLEQEHSTCPGIYLKFAKKSTGIASITAAEAVEVALCFGWIDGRANSVDDKWWLVRYTPRRSKSIWSQKNVKTIARLIEEGKLRPAGLAAVNAAKADGRWERAYAGPATMTVPDDLATALANDSAAQEFFDGLNKSGRYSVLWRVETASPATRAKRIDALVQFLAAGSVPGHPTKAAATDKQQATVPKAPKKRQADKKAALEPKRPKSTPSTSSQPSQPRREGLRSRG